MSLKRVWFSSIPPKTYNAPANATISMRYLAEGFDPWVVLSSYQMLVWKEYWWKSLRQLIPSHPPKIYIESSNTTIECPKRGLTKLPSPFTRFHTLLYKSNRYMSPYIWLFGPFPPYTYKPLFQYRKLCSVPGFGMLDCLFRFPLRGISVHTFDYTSNW